jgi:DNA-binding NtrC family response regulator
LEYLQNQLWPGNVRQLMHTVERASIFSESDLIGPADFGLQDVEPGQPLHEPSVPDRGRVALPVTESPDPGPMRVSSAVGQVEEQLIRQAMVRNHGNKKRVATDLGISRSYLYKRLAQMGLRSGASGQHP